MPPSTETELNEFVDAFESCTLPKREWTHAAHLAIGAHYAMACDATEAMTRLRQGIRRLNESHGVENSDTGGYHETITRFWLTVVRRFLCEHEAKGPKATRVERVAVVVKAFEGERGLFRPHWTFDIVSSTEARRRWIEPDAVPLENADAQPLATRAGW